MGPLRALCFSAAVSLSNCGVQAATSVGAGGKTLALLSNAPSVSVVNVFNQSEATAVYTSVGTTILANGRAYFAVADGLNAVRGRPPI